MKLNYIISVYIRRILLIYILTIGFGSSLYGEPASDTSYCSSHYYNHEVQWERYGIVASGYSPDGLADMIVTANGVLAVDSGISPHYLDGGSNAGGFQFLPASTASPTEKSVIFDYDSADPNDRNYGYRWTAQTAGKIDLMRIVSTRHDLSDTITGSIAVKHIRGADVTDLKVWADPNLGLVTVISSASPLDIEVGDIISVESSLSITTPNKSGHNLNYDIVFTPAGACDPNNAPQADDDSQGVLVNSTNNVIKVLENDTFGNDGPSSTTIVVTTEPTKGTVTIDNGGTPDDPTDDTLLYTPTSGYTGTDTIKYLITDADGETSEATVTLTVWDDSPTETETATATPADLDAIYGSGTYTTQKEVYTYTGADVDVIAPTCATGVHVKLWGAGGGGQVRPKYNEAGSGGFTEAVLPVNPGEKFTVVVGRGGFQHGDSNTLSWYGFGGSSLHDAGGGLTGFFTGVSPVIATDQARALAIAGGGGGADDIGRDETQEGLPTSYASGMNGNSLTSGGVTGSFIGSNFDHVDDGHDASDGNPSHPENWITAGGGGYEGGSRTDYLSRMGYDSGNTNDDLPHDTLYLAVDYSSRGGSGYVHPNALFGSIEYVTEFTSVNVGAVHQTPRKDDADYVTGVGLAGSGSTIDTFQDGTILQDATGGHGLAVVTWVCGNQPPVANPDSNTTPEDTTLVVPKESGLIDGNDTDPDGDPLSVTKFTDGNQTKTAGETLELTEGNLTVDANGSYTFVPAPNFNGDVPQITYTITDGDNNASSTLDIVVTPVNDAPIAVDDSDTTPFETPVTIDVDSNDTDPENDINTTSVTITSNPSDGNVSVDPTTGEVTYTPDNGFSGTDTFTYKICDNGMPVLCDEANVTVTVAPAPVNNAPVANPDSNTTPEDTTLVVPKESGLIDGNDTDPDGDPLSVTKFTDGNQTKTAGETLELTEGNLTVDANGSYTFVPAPNFNGDVPQITYTITDGDNNASSTLDIVVTPVNDAPIAVDDSDTTPFETPVTIDVDSNDTDPENDLNTSSIKVTKVPKNGTTTINSSGEIVYTPDNGFSATDTFTYEICDNGMPVLCDEANVTVTVAPVTPPGTNQPNAVDDNATTSINTPVDIDVDNNDNDPDSDLNATSVTITTQPIYGGTVDVNDTTGEVTYTPATNFSGVDEFTYKICDSTTPTPLCDEANVTVTVVTVPTPTPTPVPSATPSPIPIFMPTPVPSPMPTIQPTDTYTISGSVWDDSGDSNTSFNGQFDITDEKIADITVVLVSNPNSNTPTCQSVKTDANGYYEFNDVESGSYLVIEEANASGNCIPVGNDFEGYTSITPNVVEINVTTSDVEQNFGDVTAVKRGCDNLYRVGYLYDDENGSTALNSINVLTGERYFKTTFEHSIDTIGHSFVNSVMIGTCNGSNELCLFGRDWNLTMLGAAKGLPNQEYSASDISSDNYLYLLAKTPTQKVIYKVDVEPNRATYTQLVDTIVLSREIQDVGDIAISFATNRAYGYEFDAVNRSYNLIDINLSSGEVVDMGILKDVQGDVIYGDAHFGAMWFANKQLLGYKNNPALYRVDISDSALYTSKDPVAIKVADMEAATHNDGFTPCRTIPPTLMYDFGDAPESYGTSDANGGAKHFEDGSDDIHIGSLVDAERDGDESIDDNDIDLADDDGVATLPALSNTSSEYSLNVSVTNTTGEEARLIGWIDFNRDGQFDANEATSIAVPNGTEGNVTLTWSGLSNIVEGQSYIRLRLSTDPILNANTPAGVALDGEVEDYAITITDDVDSDSDGIPDADDIDDDNDGIPDVVEENGDANRDTDGDGIVDRLDLDSDNDGILDIQEANGVDSDHDGRVDDPSDDDNDGLANVADSEPNTPNNPTDVPSGLAVTTLPTPDTDGDGKRDFQDVDSDNDGMSDLFEGDAIDPTRDRNNDGMINVPLEGGVDANGIPSVATPKQAPDTDGDGVPNYRDLDSDNDGLNDVVEANGEDRDGNALIDTPNKLVDPTQIPDSNNNQVIDPWEPNNPVLVPTLDTNSDGVVDNPKDSDGDGIADVVDDAPNNFSDTPINKPTAQDDYLKVATSMSAGVIDVMDNDTQGSYPLNPSSIELTTERLPTGAKLSEDTKQLIVPNEGVWSVDDTTGKVTFTPNKGYLYDPTPIEYQIADSKGNIVTATITMDYPAVAIDDRAEGKRDEVVTIDVVANDITNEKFDLSTLKLIDENGNEVEIIEVPAEGTWIIDTGKVTFNPISGFTGEVTPVEYSVKEEDGDPVISTATIYIDYPEVIDDVKSDPNAIAGETPIAVSIFDNDPMANDSTRSIVLSTLQIRGTENPGDSLVVDGEGTWSIDGDKIIFTPLPSFLSNPTPIEYSVEDDRGVRSNYAKVYVYYPFETNDDIVVGEPDKPISIDIGENDSGIIDTGKIELGLPDDCNSGAIISEDKKKIIVPNQGEWEIDENGIVTFTPYINCNVTPDPITCTSYDKDGNDSSTSTIIIKEGECQNCGQVDSASSLNWLWLILYSAVVSLLYFTWRKRKQRLNLK